MIRLGSVAYIPFLVVCLKYVHTVASSDELRLHVCLPDLPSNKVCPRNEYVLASCAGPGYLGCFHDAITDVVDPLLPDYPNEANDQPWWMDDNMTIEKCLDSCRKLQNMSFAGLQAGNLCFCGTARRQLDFRIYLADDQSQCNDPCTGNEYEICGGERRTAIYDILLGICDNPDVPENGQAIMDNSLENRTFPFGAVVTFSCNPGFILIGSPSIQCVLGNMPNESLWNTTIPICQKIPTTSTRAPPSTTMPLTLMTAVSVTNSTNIGIIVGLIGGGLVVILFILGTIYCICRRKSGTKENTQNTEMETYTNNPDQDQAYQNADILQANDMYLGLDTSSRQPESVYQGVVEPEKLKTADDYLSLDAASQQGERVYQGINKNVLTNIDLDENRIYHGIDENLPETNPESYEYENPPSQVPVPPAVKGISASSGPYVNVKETLANAIVK